MGVEHVLRYQLFWYRGSSPLSLEELRRRHVGWTSQQVPGVWGFTDFSWERLGKQLAMGRPRMWMKCTWLFAESWPRGRGHSMSSNMLLRFVLENASSFPPQTRYMPCPRNVNHMHVWGHWLWMAKEESSLFSCFTGDVTVVCYLWNDDMTGGRIHHNFGTIRIPEFHPVKQTSQAKYWIHAGPGGDIQMARTHPT